MSKKSMKKKMRLGKALRANKRVPVLAVLRTHRKVQYNKFNRSWKHKKLRIKEE